MSADLTVRKLFNLHQERLALVWVAGLEGADRELRADGVIDFPTSLVGHLNLVRPNRVQVLGRAECEYLDGLAAGAAEDVLERIFRDVPVCIIVADGLTATDSLRRHADQAHTALLNSGLPSQKVVGDLQHYLSHLLARRVTLHGVFMEVIGAGTLLTGESGVGKSELALELISRGHRLIADDAPEFSLIAPDTLEGTCPPAIKEFMEVRGLGIVNARTLFGDSSIKQRKYLRLIIHLEPMQEARYQPADRLQGIQRSRRILGVEVPTFTLPVAPGRNLAVLVECTVRNHILRMKGYDAFRDFEEKQRRFLDDGVL